MQPGGDDRAPVFVTASRPGSPCSLSLVIPAFNECNRLPATLERVATYLSAQPFSYELILVDDGSADTTREVITSFVESHSWARLVLYDDAEGRPTNRGKGYAVRQGMLHALGDIVLFSDADLSTPIEEMERLLPPIEQGQCDITIGSRGLPSSHLTVHQPWHRELMGRSFNRVVQRLLLPGIFDTQCGFKAFSAAAARRIFSVARLDGFSFDVEALFIARHAGLRIEEIPVTWQHREDSRVGALNGAAAFAELLRIRGNERRGLYAEAQRANM